MLLMILSAVMAVLLIGGKIFMASAVRSVVYRMNLVYELVSAEQLGLNPDAGM